jgi:hypothetical protein
VNNRVYLCPAITKIQRITPKMGLDNFSAKDRVARARQLTTNLSALPAIAPAN